jgi:hypothetical protein
VVWDKHGIGGGGEYCLRRLRCAARPHQRVLPRGLTSARSIGFCAIWVCISSSSSSHGIGGSGEYCGDNDAHLDRINVFYHEASGYEKIFRDRNRPHPA